MTVMETQHLFVSWDSKPPLEGRNVWRVDGDIEYKDGKLVFRIVNGSLVKIDPEQLVRIGITKTKEQLAEMIDKIKNKKDSKFIYLAVQVSYIGSYFSSGLSDLSKLLLLVFRQFNRIFH